MCAEVYNKTRERNSTTQQTTTDVCVTYLMSNISSCYSILLQVIKTNLVANAIDLLAKKPYVWMVFQQDKWAPVSKHPVQSIESRAAVYWLIVVIRRQQEQALWYGPKRNNGRSTRLRHHDEVCWYFKDNKVKKNQRHTTNEKPNMYKDIYNNNLEIVKNN